MAKFEVHYLFTCKKCGKVNNEWVELEASQESVARELAHNQAKCSYCSVAPEPNQPITMMMKAID